MFKKKITLYSVLSLVDLQYRISTSVNDKKKHINLKHTYFEGCIGDKQFKIYPTFEYNSRELFRPEIIGELKEGPNSINFIMLTIKLPIFFKILFAVVLLINLLVVFLLLALNLDLIEYPRLISLIIIIFIIIFFILLLFYFNYKSEKSVKYLKIIFEAKKYKEKN